MMDIRAGVHSQRILLVLTLVGGLAFSMSCLAAQMPQRRQAVKKLAVSQSAASSSGERKFRANCSRCHTAPEQLSPRITGTIMLHMRVRASLSAADAQDILHYLSP